MSINDRLYRRAEQLFNDGNSQDARSILVNILESDPNHIDSLFLIQQTTSNVSERKYFLERIINLEPNHVGAQAALTELNQTPLIITEEDVATPPPPPETPITTKQYEKYESAIIALITALIVTFACTFYMMVSDSQKMNDQKKTIQAMADENSRISAQYYSLEEAHHIQTNNLETLLAEHEYLNDLYTNLSTKFSELTNNYDNLVWRYNDLNGRYTSLEASHANLTTSYNDLNQEHNELINYYAPAIVPPYIHVLEEREIELVFKRSDDSINRWQASFEGFEQDIVRGYRDRALIKKNEFESMIVIDQYGNEHTIVDYRKFVDPKPFKRVVSEVLEDTNNEYELIYELWYITSQLTNYDPELEDTPRYPLETFLAGGGDCEDTAILLASMLKAVSTNNMGIHNGGSWNVGRWDVSLVFMDGNKPTELEDPNHMIVQLETDDYVYLIETTNPYEMLPYKDGVRGWFFQIDS